MADDMAGTLPVFAAFSVRAVPLTTPIGVEDPTELSSPTFLWPFRITLVTHYHNPHTKDYGHPTKTQTSAAGNNGARVQGYKGR
jgi:hypothetical protein